jgi:hypothetical protein
LRPHGPYRRQTAKPWWDSLLWWCWLSCQESSLSSRLADVQKRTGGCLQVLGNKPARDTYSSQSVGAIRTAFAAPPIWRPCISRFPTPDLLLLHVSQPRRSCMHCRSHLTGLMHHPPSSSSPHTLNFTAGFSVSWLVTLAALPLLALLTASTSVLACSNAAALTHSPSLSRACRL